MSEEGPIPLPENLVLKPGQSMEQRDETGSVFRIIKMRPDGQMTSSAPPGPPGESYDEAIARRRSRLRPNEGAGFGKEAYEAAVLAGR